MEHDGVAAGSGARASGRRQRQRIPRLAEGWRPSYFENSNGDCDFYITDDKATAAVVTSKAAVQLADALRARTAVQVRDEHDCVVGFKLPGGNVVPAIFPLAVMDAEALGSSQASEHLNTSVESRAEDPDYKPGDTTLQTHEGECYRGEHWVTRGSGDDPGPSQADEDGGSEAEASAEEDSSDSDSEASDEEGSGEAEDDSAQEEVHCED